MASPLPIANPKPTHLLEDLPTPTTALLSSSSSSLPPQRLKTQRAFLFSILTLTICFSIASALAFAFLFFSSLPTTAVSDPHHAPKPLARPLSKLQHPVVLMVSFDGFRYGYQFKTPTPNIDSLVANGTEAYPGLIPIFPSLTFPNHYSIVTGLYAPYHGIVSNYFVDPTTGDVFNKDTRHAKWWLGEPLWETVSNQGFNAAAYFWAGSEAKKGSWQCPPKFCPKYNGSVPFEERVDTVLSYFDLPSSEIPIFICLYFSEPDELGHKIGPDDLSITDAIARLDEIVGRLIDGLQKREIFEDVTLILLGDHGMVGNCDEKLIFLEDLSPWIEIPHGLIDFTGPLLTLRPPQGVSPAEVVAMMNEGLSSGKVENGAHLRVFLKEDLPERFHYSASDRIAPVIGLLDEGYKVFEKRSKRKYCGGDHGYDNELFSMRSIFVAHGPRFERGKKVPSFENVEIYNMVTSILNLNGAPNNGSASFANSIILPSA